MTDRAQGSIKEVIENLRGLSDWAKIGADELEAAYSKAATPLALGASSEDAEETNADTITVMPVRPDAERSGSMVGDMTTYTLITVNGSGEVYCVRGFPTLEACEDAKCIALTGMAVAENKAADEAYAAAQKEWEENHPWREPETEWERKVCASKSNGTASDGYRTWGLYNGKIRELRSPGCGVTYTPMNGEWAEWIRGKSYVRSRFDIKTAKCVMGG